MKYRENSQRYNQKKGVDFLQVKAKLQLFLTKNLTFQVQVLTKITIINRFQLQENQSKN